MAEPYSVPAVQAAVRLLEALADADEHGASQADLGRETGIAKSTAHNLLGTLEREGFARRDPRTLRYHLGGALIPLGAAAARQIRVMTLALEALPPLAAQLGLSMAIGQLTPAGDVQVIERAYPPGPLHVGIRIGSRYGPFDGAIGKCLLAALPAPEAESLVRARPIPAHTQRTLTEPERLLEDVARSRERGWAASIGEYNRNVAVAATLRGADGMEGVLLGLGFPEDLAPDQVPAVGAALRERAREIGERAGAGGHFNGGSSAADGSENHTTVER